MAICEAAHDIFSILIDAIKKKVLELCFVRKFTSLLVANFLNALLFLIKFGLHSHNLILLIVIVGPKESNNLLTSKVRFQIFL